MTTRLIIDCDTGSDDAVALFAAAEHPELDLIGVTTVNGNVPLENTTENSLRVIDHIGANVPVYRGAPRPIVRPDYPVPRPALEGTNAGFQIYHLDFPPSKTALQEKGAVQFLIDTYMDDANLDVVLVAVGPLTNVALALAAEPALASRIPKLVIMGGAIGWGNVTPAAEFNFWVDPEAARSVLSAGIRDVVIMPLDATHSAPLTLRDCAALDALGTPAATASSQFIRHRITQDHTQAGEGDLASAPVHDPLCVAYLLRPDVVTSSGAYPVTVETSGEHTLGEMIVDTRPWASDPVTATVTYTASAEIFREVLLEAFAG